MDLPIFAQTLFYLVASFAMIALGVVISIFIFYAIKFARVFGRISENIEKASDDLKDNVSHIFNRLADIPLLSFFMKSRADRKNKKNKNNHEKNK